MENIDTFTAPWPYDQRCTRCGRRVGADSLLVLARRAGGVLSLKTFCFSRKHCVQEAEEHMRIHSQTTTAWFWPSWPRLAPTRFYFRAPRQAVG